MAAGRTRTWNRAPRGYCETPNSLVQNLGLLTHAELCLAMVNCRLGAEKKITDEVWSQWTGLHPRMKQHASRGLTKRGCLRVEGRGDKALFTFDRDAWNKYALHAERSKPRTEGRRAVDPKPGARVDPECREKGCGLLRMRCGESGLTPDPATSDAKPVSISAAAACAPTGFAGCVPSVSPNFELSPTVTASDAKPVSKNTPTNAGPVHPAKAGSPAGGGRTPAPQTSGAEALWAASLAMLQTMFPLVGLAFLSRLVATVCALFSGVTDSELAGAIRVAWAWNRARQKHEGLFLFTVPEAIRVLRKGGGGDPGVDITGQPISPKPPFDLDHVRAFLARNGTSLREGGFGVQAAALEALDVGALYGDLGKFEDALTVIEADLLREARASAGEDLLAELRASLAHELRSYQAKMSADQLVMLEAQFVERRLLERFKLPRLSLFYL